MKREQDSDSRQLQIEVQAITTDIRTLANRYQGNSRALLALLRALEQTHRQIHEDLFQASLPNNRHELYALLRDIEEAGGWPYIERMRLRSLLSNLPELGINSPDNSSQQ